MRRPLQVGITGGIGAGKSFIAQCFHSLGVPVYDADTQAKKLMTSDPVLVLQIKQRFGDQSFASDGTLDRRYLSSVIFNDGGEVDDLNSLVHPRVADDFAHWMKMNASSRYVLKEAALLYETGSAATLEKIIVVVAPQELRISRVLARDPQRTRQEVIAIMAKQMPQEEKEALADYVINNDGISDVAENVRQLHAALTAT